MRKLIYIAFPLLIGCSGGEDAPNNMDYEDFAGETGLEENDTLVQSVDTSLDLSTSEGRLIHSLQEDYDTVENSSFNALDRFSFSESKKLGFKGKFEVPYGKSTMVYPIAKVFYYSFSDTTSTKNAFYNYLDGLSSNGEVDAIKINQDVESIKSPPLTVMMYDTVIVSAEYMCEHAENNWLSFEEALLSVYGSDFRYKIEINCGGPLKWVK